MSKTTHTSNGALEDHGTLADSELDAVSGGKEKLKSWFKGLETIIDARISGAVTVGAINGASGAV